MLVYRVENGKGEGPYRHGYPEKLGIHYDWRHKADALRYPHPYNDGIHLPALTVNHSFGFKSVGDLHNWFADAFQALDRYGFRVCTYEVPESDVLMGIKQLAFDSSRAERVYNG